MSSHDLHVQWMRQIQGIKCSAYLGSLIQPKQLSTKYPTRSRSIMSSPMPRTLLLLVPKTTTFYSWFILIRIGVLERGEKISPRGLSTLRICFTDLQPLLSSPRTDLRSLTSIQKRQNTVLGRFRRNQEIPKSVMRVNCYFSMVYLWTLSLEQ